MKFRVRKASDWGSKNKPCEKAVLSNIADKTYGDHRYWFVEINTLEELLDLCHETLEDLVISPNCNESEVSEFPNIIIYDDYIE